MKSDIEQTLVSNKGVSQAESGGKNILGKGNSQVQKPKGRSVTGV